MRHYDKLVRDLIPNIIEAEGNVPRTKVVSNQEVIPYLIRKMKEELAEFEDSGSIEELADVQEVLNALVMKLGYTTDQLEGIRRQKSLSRGGFNDNIILVSVKETTDSD